MTYDKFDICDFDVYLTFSIEDCQSDPESKFAFIVAKEHFYDCVEVARRKCDGRKLPCFYYGDDFACGGRFVKADHYKINRFVNFHINNICIFTPNRHIENLAVDKLFVDRCVLETPQFLKVINEISSRCDKEIEEMEELGLSVNEADWLAILNNTYEE